MTTAIDQKSYLQKYLGGPSGDKKKRKKKVKGKGFKIIDDDLDLSKLRPLDGDELDILNEGEDAPQIAGIIDERPEELKKMEAFQTSSKWRVINQDDGFNSKLKVEEVKRNMKEVEKENEIVFGKMYSDSEDEQKNESDASLPRRNDNKNSSNSKKNQKHSSDSDFSPPRKNNMNKHSKSYDSDISPPRKNAKNDRASSSSPRRKNSTVNSKSKTKVNSDQSPLRKHSKNTASNDKRSRIDQTHSKRSKNQNNNDASPQRRKDENQNKNRVRKPSRWGDFKDESNCRAVSPKNRSEKRKSSTDRQRNESNSSKKYSNDSDVSPPRKSRRDSPKRNRTPDSDESPHRKRKQLPDKRKNNEYRDSLSPKKNKNHKYSEQTKRSHESSKRRHESDSDVSPPRQERNKSKGNDVKRSKGRDTESDSSPATQERRKIYNKHTANRGNRRDSDSDVSPPRKERNKNDSKSKRKNSDSDLSPPRKARKNYQERRDESLPSNKKMEKTLEGKLAGLQDARQLKQENESFRRREDEAFRNMTDEMSGRNAKIVSRKGKRETSEDRQKQREKADRQKVLDEKYKQWSKGLKQIESQQAAVQDFIHESSKPLARYKDDRDLESKLKDVERQGDPMLQYIREKKRERGELGPEKPMYKGNFPPNRFNIRPGYRWDGVDRSNGYENKYFAQQSKRKAQEEEVYKWSTEDL